MSSSQPEVKSAVRAKKVVIPKVWKRPHSTIYGKNVEFGSKLYSDKLGEINGRKFNSELPWQVRNSGASSASTSSSASQGYISSLLLAPDSTLAGSVLVAGGRAASAASQLDCADYAHLLELTNPGLYSSRRARGRPNSARRIDFYAQFLEPFEGQLRQMGAQSRLAHEPLLHRRAFDKFLDFNHELGLFVSGPPCSRWAPGGGASSGSGASSSSSSRAGRASSASASGAGGGAERGLLASGPGGSRLVADGCGAEQGRSRIFKRSLEVNRPASRRARQEEPSAPINHNQQFTPVCTNTLETALLPKHACQLASSPYGQSADGRKLSLGSIKPHSYRPSLPAKSSTVHASDGEEFEFQDRSSPFYTDRWAGKTIRHFDSDLYSNANLFKSMIL